MYYSQARMNDTVLISIQEDKPIGNQMKKSKRRHRCWSAVNHNFLNRTYTSMKRREIPNGKISQKVYIDQILQPIVKPWIEAHHRLCLRRKKIVTRGMDRENPTLYAR